MPITSWNLKEAGGKVPPRGTRTILGITGGWDEATKQANDLDLEKFFDKVNHSKLKEVRSRTVKDGRVVSLIHKYLNAGVQVGSSYEASEIGVLQGGH